MATNSIPNTEIVNEKNFRETETQSRPFQDSLSKPQAADRPTFGSNVGRAINTGDFALGLGQAAVNAVGLWNKYSEGPDIRDYLSNREELQQAVESGNISPARASALRREMRNKAISAYGNNPYAVNKIINMEKLATGSSEAIINQYEQNVQKVADAYYKLTGEIVDVYNEDSIRKANSVIQERIALQAKVEAKKAELEGMERQDKIDNLTLNNTVAELGSSLVEEGYNYLGRSLSVVANGGNISAEEYYGFKNTVNNYRALISRASAGRDLPAAKILLNSLNTIESSFDKAYAAPLEEKKRLLEEAQLNFELAINSGKIPEALMKRIAIDDTFSPTTRRLAAQFFIKKDWDKLNAAQKKEAADAAVALVANAHSEECYNAFISNLLYAGSEYHPEAVYYLTQGLKADEATSISTFKNMTDAEGREVVRRIEENFKNTSSKIKVRASNISNQYDGKPIDELVEITNTDTGFIVRPKTGIVSSNSLSMYCNDLQTAVNNRIYLYALVAASRAGRSNVDTRGFMITNIAKDTAEYLREYGDVKWNQKEQKK